MHYISYYNSPVGKLLIAENNQSLIGLWIEGQTYYCSGLDTACLEKETPLIKEVKKWLDIYFSGKEPNFMPALNPNGTKFRQNVWKILQKIPYGETITYKDIAKQIAEKNSLKTMSAQAVGGAVGHNPISIIIPCHRVIGTKNNLTGYAGGIENKIKLLRLEGCNINEFTIP